ncbi:MAG: site-2 protease family protein [Nitrospira sp.]|nr:site-2 protease family protein [Nitrospira sp.]MCP9443239.1 site-2 protease family protein [Nitrospira sp.]
MIGQSMKLARIRGIDVGIHYSWFIIFVLITFSLTARFSAQHPHWTTAEQYAVGVATSLLFFVSILLHELAHSFVALAKGIPVRSITLFVFGGVAQIGREPDRPMTEFQIAIAGPLASGLLAVGFGVLASLAGDQFERLAALADWLSSINVMLALFNLVPGFPLDGGRMFRALIWYMTGSLTRATRVAAGAGQGIGYVFMFFGIWTGFTANWFSGLWLAFIGWFLMNAAQESVVQVSVRSVLSGLVAEDVMSRDCPIVSERMSLAELVGEHVLRTGQRCFTVTDGDRLKGLVTLHQIKAVPQDRWSWVMVGEAMTPASQVQVVAPDRPILEVLQLLEGQDINQVPVVEGDRLVGMITRDHLLRVLAAKMELQLPGKIEQNVTGWSNRPRASSVT